MNDFLLHRICITMSTSVRIVKTFTIRSGMGGWAPVETDFGGNSAFTVKFQKPLDVNAVAGWPNPEVLNVWVQSFYFRCFRC